MAVGLNERELEVQRGQIGVLFSGLVYCFFGCSGPITQRQKDEFLKAHGYAGYSAFEAAELAVQP